MLRRRPLRISPRYPLSATRYFLPMNWSRFKSHFYHNEDLGFSLDVSRIAFPDEFLATMGAKMQQAFAEMASLEKGTIANPDEKRMVGHYWLRSPHLAPTNELASEISTTLANIK